MEQFKPSSEEKPSENSLTMRLGKRIEAKFDGGLISSDGGSLLVRKADRELELTEMAVLCLTDWRQGSAVKHSLQALFLQRLVGLCTGAEDCNDAAVLRFDPMHKLAVGKLPSESPLASQPTLSRFENSVDSTALKALHELLVHVFVRKHKKPPKVVKLDLDTTCDETYGYQQLTFYNGFYKTDCYVPLFIFTDEGFPLAALLRPGNAAPGEGALRMLKMVVHNLRLSWPEVQIEFKADSAFALPELYEYCEANNVTYYISLKPNASVEYHTKELVVECKRLFEELTGQPPVTLRHGKMCKKEVRRRWRQKEERLRFSSKEEGRMQEHFEQELEIRKFREFRYSARGWSHERRIVARVTYTNTGPEVRFVVTNSTLRSARKVYERYCMRARCENWIKDLKLYLKSGRTSCQEFNANQFRLLLHTFAYTLLWTIRKAAGMGFETLETVRNRLLKVGVRIRETSHAVFLQFPSMHPWKELFERSWAKLAPE